MSFTGPALTASDTAHPGIEYEVEWGDVAALAGGQARPWWPYLLRLPQLINKWEPGAPRAVAEVPPSANEKTLRRAARNDVFDADSRTALTDMANDIRNRRTTSVVHDNEIFGERGYREKPNAVIIGAGSTPPTTPCPSSTTARPFGPAGASSL